MKRLLNFGRGLLALFVLGLLVITLPLSFGALERSAKSPDEQIFYPPLSQTLENSDSEPPYPAPTQGETSEASSYPPPLLPTAASLPYPPPLSPTPLPTMPPPTPNPSGWLAQKLHVVSDKPFEVQAFSIKEGDQVEGAVWSPDSQSIIVDHFLGYEQVSQTEMLPQRELWALNLDGTGELVGVNALAATWSPNGDAIAYLHRPAIREYELWVNEWPKGTKRQLMSKIGLRRPDWLDSKTILFADSKGSILSVDGATKEFSRVTDVEAWAEDPIQGINFALSPNRDWFVVRAQQEKNKLMMVSLKEPQAQWLVPENPDEGYSFIVENMAWSSDGTRFAFTGGNSKVGEVIYVVDVRTKLEWKLLLYPIVTMPHFLSWSPDGNMLAFSARNEDTRKTNLYVINVDGSHLRNLSRDKELYIRAPAWSPDGHNIFYSEYSDKDITTQPRLMQIKIEEGD